MTTSTQTEGLTQGLVPCPQCARPTAPGKFCSACGTRVPAAMSPSPGPPTPAAPNGSASAPRRAWLPAAIVGAIAVAALAVAAVLLIVLGGEPSSSEVRSKAAGESVDAVRLSATNLYAPVEMGPLSAQVPAGWRRADAKVPGVTGVTATSAQDKGASVTVGMLGGASRSLAQAARDVRAERRDLAGYEETAFAKQTLAGERPAWKLRYDRDGEATVEYLTKACGGVLVVSGSAPKAAFENLESRYGVVARSAMRVC
jgi:hypothetical protein